MFLPIPSVCLSNAGTTDLVEDEEFRNMAVRPVSDLVRDCGQHIFSAIDAAHRAVALLGQHPVVQHEARAGVETQQAGVCARRPCRRARHRAVIVSGLKSKFSSLVQQFCLRLRHPCVGELREVGDTRHCVNSIPV